jgi:hypothetical protein
VEEHRQLAARPLSVCAVLVFGCQVFHDQTSLSGAAEDTAIGAFFLFAQQRSLARPRPFILYRNGL